MPATGSSSSLDRLRGVSCASVRTCTAVGRQNTGFDASASLAVRWNVRRWSIRRTPHPTDVSLSTGVVHSAKSCIAIGSFADPRIGQTRPPVERLVALTVILKTSDPTRDATACGLVES